MYRLMIYYLLALIIAAAVLSLLGILPYVWWHILADSAVLAMGCWGANALIARIFRTRPFPQSQWITAFILTLIIGPINPLDSTSLTFLLTAAIISQAGKYLLAINKKHVFNPAATAVLATALILGQGASWWVGDWHLLPIIIIGGFLILRKLRWFDLTLSFLGVYVLGLIALFGPRLNYATLLAPLLFFATVMLIEPRSTPAGRRNRIFYGSIIAIVLLLLVNYSNVSYNLELSLLVGNLLFWFTKNKERLTMKFLDKERAAQGIYKFWFDPGKKFYFLPGQYLEWTLPHPQADNRGVRRWFTIASAPTENQVLLTTKIFDKPSTFKNALNQLMPGTELVVSDPDGDFTLPDDPATKLLFIAGGIGVTPFRSMVKFLIDQNQSRDIVLLYLAKTADEFAFRELWKQANRTFGLKTIYLETEKEGPLTMEKTKKSVPDWMERIFYVSGPEPMVEAFEKMFQAGGVSSDRIKTDFFPGYESF